MRNGPKWCKIRTLDIGVHSHKTKNVGMSLDIVGESVETVGEVAAIVCGEEVGGEPLRFGRRRLGRHHAVHHEASHLGLWWRLRA